VAGVGGSAQSQPLPLPPAAVVPPRDAYTLLLLARTALQRLGPSDATRKAVAKLVEVQACLADVVAARSSSGDTARDCSGARTLIARASGRRGAAQWKVRQALPWVYAWYHAPVVLSCL
jgi:hypothetical protein